MNKIKNAEIPTSKWGGDYIDYKGKILILQKNPKGKSVEFQFDGVSCSQGTFKGTIYKSFKSESEWFDTDRWYEKTTWSNDSDKIYFSNPDHNLKIPNLFGGSIEPEKMDTMWESLCEAATLKATPVAKILQEIKTEVQNQIQEKIEFDFEDTEYGKFWYEALIPIKIKGKSYLLTWENCD